MIKTDPKTTWRELITVTMDDVGEKWEDVVAFAPTDMDLDREFYDGFGGSEGKPFTLWTKNRVYFPVVYDGAEWVGSVPRNPNGEITKHIGGQ